MTGQKPRTSAENGRLWGQSTRDWADIQEGQFRAGFLAAFERAGIKDGTAYLDAGCGAGMAAQLAAERGAVVHGVDASDAMLEVARERVPAGDFQVADLESLPFADDGFDVVAGFNAFQYAGNPVTALAEARRVTKPSGTVIIMTWGEPQGMEAASLVGALKHLMPPPPPGAAGPFALSDEAKLRAFAVEAGLTPIDVLDVDSPWHYPDVSTGVRGLGSTGVAASVAAVHGRAAVEAALAEALVPFRQHDGHCAIGSACRILIAQAP